jgi:hypothetical protein
MNDSMWTSLVRSLLEESDDLVAHQQVLETRIRNQRNELYWLHLKLDEVEHQRNAYARFVDESRMEEFLPIMRRIQNKATLRTEEQQRERDAEREREQLGGDDEECCCTCDCAPREECCEDCPPVDEAESRRLDRAYEDFVIRCFRTDN